MRLHTWLIVCGASMVLSLPLFAVGSIAPSQEIATPVTKPVVIDGNLSEWDASIKDGPVSFDEEAASDYNGTFCVMYDKDNIYLSAVVVEPHPPYNPYPTRGIDAYNGDEVVVRMSGNPNLTWPITMSEEEAAASPDLFSMQFWHNHVTKKTMLAGRFGLSHLSPAFTPKQLGTVEAVVKPAGDGKGYTLEARMPWKLINPAFHPKPGDRVFLSWQVNIGSDSAAEPTRIFEIFGNGASADTFRSVSAWHGQILFK